MKGNSIEEDIKLLEELDWLYLDKPEIICDKYEEATNHILSDYKRVLKINEVLLKENEELKNDIKNMYDEEVVISIIEDNFNLCRNEVLEMLKS